MLALTSILTDWINVMDWLTASEALALLGTQPQTLYANVSRGRIKARPDPLDSRRSLYRGDDVRRLAQRTAGRRKQETVAVQAMQWGEPVLPTSISTVRDGRLLYRGEDACRLAAGATLEEVAELLWQAPIQFSAVEGRAQGLPGAFLALAEQAGHDVASARSGSAAEASLVLSIIAHHLAGGSVTAPLHIRLSRHWQAPAAADIIRRALVLLADHELNSSTFAARVAVSTGASLWAGTLAALATLRSPRHGLASRHVAALAEDVGSAADPEAALREWLGEGRAVPGVGHPLYPDGDGRCQALLQSFEAPADYMRFADAASEVTGDAPNIDFALAAMRARFSLPADAGIILFALARSVGWQAHMLEQVASGQQIRPRARYTGP